MSTDTPRAPSAVLTSAVHAALHALVDLRAPGPTVEDGRVELALREAVAVVERAAHARPRAVSHAVVAAAAAARTACAYMGARQWEDCYLALRSAGDHLAGRAD